MSSFFSIQIQKLSVSMATEDRPPPFHCLLWTSFSVCLVTLKKKPSLVVKLLYKEVQEVVFHLIPVKESCFLLIKKNKIQLLPLDWMGGDITSRSALKVKILHTFVLVCAVTGIMVASGPELLLRAMYGSIVLLQLGL